MPVGRPGSVAIVGAGPGDPGLLTVRAVAAIRSADVILHDRLVSDEILALAPTHARMIDVGKMPNGPSTPQAVIHAALLEHARTGAMVVRLKGGDPFVFGRGNEERDVCDAAGVRCDVIPGLTSALAGPHAAGIPVTARGVARSFAVVTARGGEDAPECEIPYEALALIDTVVVLMGRADLATIAERLVDAGRSPATPAALIERATCPDERIVRATLGTIARAADDAAVESPAVLVVGTTAAIGRGNRRGPLAGRRVLVTRPSSANERLVAAVRALGATAIDAPLIRIEYPDPPPPVDLGTARWLVLTSLHGVRGFARALDAAGRDARSLAGLRVAAVGPRTADELRACLAIRADVVPEDHRATALVARLVPLIAPGEQVVFPCGTLARDEVSAGLAAAGVDVRELVVYDTLPQAPTRGARRAIERGVDATLLYSPSAARALAELGPALLRTPVVCVGPTTAAAACELGFADVHVAERYGDDGVLECLRALLEPASNEEAA